MADIAAELANQINSPANDQNLPYTQMRFGKVTAVQTADNSCTVQLSGDTGTSIPGVKSLNIFQPTVNDTVCILMNKSDAVVIGKTLIPTAMTFAQITNIITNVNILVGPTGFNDLISTPNSVTINKKYASSNLFISLSITGWGDGTSTGFTSAVKIGSTDYITGAINLDLRPVTGGNTVLQTQRVPCVGSTVVAGLPVGSTTVTIRIKNHNGSGNLHVDTGDFYTLTVQEML